MPGGQEVGPGGDHLGGVPDVRGAAGEQVDVPLAGQVEAVPAGAAQRAGVDGGGQRLGADRAAQPGDDLRVRRVDGLLGRVRRGHPQQPTARAGRAGGVSDQLKCGEVAVSVRADTAMSAMLRAEPSPARGSAGRRVGASLIAGRRGA